MREIAARSCPWDKFPHLKGERCPEYEASSMGGQIPAAEQRRRWCSSCMAREALKGLS